MCIHILITSTQRYIIQSVSCRYIATFIVFVVSSTASYLLVVATISYGTLPHIHRNQDDTGFTTTTHSNQTRYRLTRIRQPRRRQHATCAAPVLKQVMVSRVNHHAQQRLIPRYPALDVKIELLRGGREGVSPKSRHTCSTHHR